MAEHAIEQIDVPPNTKVGSVQPEKNCIIPPFFETREDLEEICIHQKQEMKEESKHSHILTPTIDLRQASLPVKGGPGDEESKMALSTIENLENREVTPKVSFRTNRDRDSPTPEISVEQHLKLPKSASHEFDNGGGILGSILAAKPKAKRANKTARPSVFERLARTETVAFIHQKFYPLEDRENRSTSAPPLMQRGKDDKTSAFTGKALSTKNTSPSPTRYSSTKQRQPVQRVVRRQSVSSFQRKNGQRPLISHGEEKKNISTRAVLDGHVKENIRNNGRKLRRPVPLTRFNSDFGAYNKKIREQTWTKGGKSSLGDSFYSRRRSKEDEAFNSYEIHDNGPPLYIEFSNRSKIICSNKYAPELGFEDIDPQQLGMRRSLTEYEAGSLHSKKLASEIIHSLLWRDLPKGLKWNINFPLERELAMPIGEVGYSFFIEATEIKDEPETSNSDLEDDKIHTASATGNVSFLPDRWEIHVENYSCVHNVDESNFLRAGGAEV